MEYLADTVALIRHFSKSGKIGRKAKQILELADKGKNIIYISMMSMIEIMYLAEGKRIPVDFDTVRKNIMGADNYRLIDISIEVVETAKEITGLELHDRLIVATGVYLKIPILTCDESIGISTSIPVIWN